MKDSNVSSSKLQGSAITGDVSGPPGSSRLTMICTGGATVSSVQALAIILTGDRPAAGTTYAISDSAPASGNGATIEYGDDPQGRRVWIATAGSVKIESVARDTVGFSFSGATMVPEAGKLQNTATGTFTLSGTGLDDDLLGFVP